MKRHEWEQLVDEASIRMICKHCGERIDTDNTEYWNLTIFGNCPER